MNRYKIFNPYGRKKCPYCKRLVGIVRNQIWKDRFELCSHGGGKCETFFCEGSGKEVRINSKHLKP